MDSTAEVADLDLQLALKLKAKYPEHFQNLVRMHLSFALDLNIDECDDAGDKMKSNPTKWGFGKRIKGGPKDSPENNALTEAGISRMHKLILFLSREENICQEGIFRRTGALTRQVQLKTCLNEGISVNFDDNNFSVHDCASVLKTFLSELPEPLVTDLYYPLYCQISEWSKCNEFEARLLRSLQLLILLLPESNALLLKHVINLLHTTANYAGQNKMSATNLATLFTPHLLCPRKLTGEALHTNTQMLYQIVVFMITSGSELFKIPAGLAADIRLYWHDKEKKKLSPKNCLNESTADSCVVNTVFSFVDREKTAQENVINPTETALAQLYAHIQSLPESSKKRKLVKQFNKENGYGTPKRVLLNNNDKPHSLTKNISDSLKRHIFHIGTGKQDKSLKNLQNDKFIPPNATPESRFKAHPLRLFDKRLDCMECGCSDTSDETNVAKKLYSNREDEIKDEPDCLVHIESDEVINERGIDPIPEENLPCTQILQTPQTQMKKSLLVRKNSSVHCKLSTPVVSTRFQGTLTSTPAPICFTNDVSTPSPFCGSNDDMSPITMSAQKMPKSMQEVMMTPRSRQPVIAISGSNTNLLSKEKIDDNSGHDQDFNKTKNSNEHYETCCSSKENTLLSNQSGESLTDTFREYLYSRSMLTTSIVDNSFSSRTGDFDPSSVSEEKLSDSLLYCLDNGTPVPENNCKFYDSFSNENGADDAKPVHETVL